MTETRVMNLGLVKMVTRQVAAAQQINAAIRLLLDHEDFAPAITLALAAEEQMPPSEEPYLFARLREQRPDRAAEFNRIRNWLKHYMEPETVSLYEFEVFIAIARAVTKYYASYGQTTQQITRFEDWARTKGYRNRPRPDSPE